MHDAPTRSAAAVACSFNMPFFVFNQTGKTVLILAAEKGQWQVCVKLAELGADIHFHKVR